MRKDDVLEVLKEVEDSITSLKEYKKITKVKLKSTLENLRSALDYIAQDINDKLPSSKNYKVYFPYGKDKESFEKNFQKNLKNLDSEFPKIYDLIESLQPHKSGHEWLTRMCSLTNEAKHKQLIGSTEEEKLNSAFIGDDPNAAPIKIELEDGVESNFYISLRDNTFLITNPDGSVTSFKKSGDYKINRNGITIIDEDSTSVEFTVTKEKKLVIDGTSTELIPFLELCFENIQTFANHVYSQLKA